MAIFQIKLANMVGVYNNSTNNTSSFSATTASVNPSSSPTLPTYVYGPKGTTEFQIAVWSTTAFLGVIGNLLVCIVICGRLRKTSMNYFLLSLAIADLGVLLMIYPVSVTKYVSPFSWLLGEQVCLYMVPTEEVFFGASIWSITAIAIERYRNIVGAKRYQVWKRSLLKTALAIIVVWLASFLVSSVPLYPLMVYNSTIHICLVQWPETPRGHAMYVSYTVTLIIVWYVLPLAVIAFTYVKIKERMLASAAFRESMGFDDSYDFPKMPQSASYKKTRDKRIWRISNKTKKILTPLVILFAVTMLPLNAMRLVMLIKPDFLNNPYYNMLVGQLGLFVIINSSANPLVYYITSKEFKDAFNAIVKSLKERKNFFSQVNRRNGSLWRSSRTTYATELEPRLANGNNNNNKNSSNNSINNRGSRPISLNTENAQFESTL